MEDNEKMIIFDSDDLIDYFIDIQKDCSNSEFCIIGSYDTIVTIINEAVRSGYDLIHAELKCEELDGYDKGFIAFFDGVDYELWVEKAYDNGEYEYIDEKNVYVEDIYVEEFSKMNDHLKFNVFGYKDSELDLGDDACLCVDDDEKGFSICVNNEDDGSTLKFTFRGNRKLSKEYINMILKESGFSK